MSQDRKTPGRWSASESFEPKKDTSSLVPLPARKNRAERLKEIRDLVTSGKLPGGHLEQPPKESGGNSQPREHNPWWRSWSNKWQFWLAVSLLMSVGMACVAISSLLNLTSQSNCAKIFWPTASANDRFFCAQEAASKRTADDLLHAIELVNALPPDHPLRPRINAQIELWSQDILRLGNSSFQEGKLEEGIAIARKVPQDVPAYATVQKQIEKWQSTWNDAEKIYRTAEDHLRQEEWSLAFREATLLLDSGNTFWESTKYEELTKVIQATKADGNKLVKARNTASEGGLDNLVTGIKLAQGIEQKSYLYQAANKLIAEFSKKIMGIAQKRLQAGDWQQAISISSKIPESANLKEQVQDFNDLAQATAQAMTGSVEGLSKAIEMAQKLKDNRPLYKQAQDSAGRWQQEMADVKTLDLASRIAAPGGVNDLRAAIAQLQTVPQSNPRSLEARSQISRLSRQIELIEDSPYLQRANDLASTGDPNSLEAAVAQASRIGQGRALYREAQGKIQAWIERRQRLQDQPFLDRAQQLAARGNLTEANEIARRIRSGRVLYEQARSNIRTWEAQFQGEQGLQNARQAAQSGTADALQTAISMASQVPQSSSLSSQASEAIEEWSQRILAIGVEQSSSDLAGAIATLKKIPSGSRAFEQARSQIQIWEQSLNPPAAESPAPASEPPAPAPDPPETEPPSKSPRR
jgi:soluble cytochrome b562